MKSIYELAPLGKRYGRLVVTDADARYVTRADGTHRFFWLCKCDCGSEYLAHPRRLITKRLQSCGCLRRERAGPPIKHGLSKTPEYLAWQQMKNRCLNPSGASWAHYGGRGIRVCDRWLEFEVFLKDVGQKPGPEYSLGRIDNEGSYEPANVEWQTARQQSKNRRRLPPLEPVPVRRLPPRPVPVPRGTWSWRGKLRPL